MAVSERHARAPRLERRPDAVNFTVEDLMADLKAGKVRVPAFQRPMRWTPAEKLQLLDSIFRGYPVGTPLFWKRRAAGGPVRLGELTLDVPEAVDALWVVDGQQRLTTLAESLLRTPQSGERAMYFDLEEGGFIWKPVPDPSRSPLSARLLPASVLLDSTQLISWIISRKDHLRPEWQAIALEVGKRVREYRLPAYVVDTADESALREIFGRINRTGRRLTDAEVFHALYSSTTGSPEARTIASVVEALAATGWGQIGDNIVVGTMRAIQGLPPDKDVASGFDTTTAQTALERAERGLAAAIEFMRDTAGVPTYALNPYALPLVVIAHFFNAFPDPTPRSLTLLRRWFWRGALAFQFAGEIIIQRRYLKCVKPGDEHDSVQALLALTAREPDRSAYQFDRVHLSEARTRLQCCALASLEPRDLRTGLPIDITQLTVDPQTSPLLPLVESGGLEARVLHPALRGEELRTAISAADDSTFTSHAIPLEARDAWLRGDGPEFLALRGRALRELLEKYFARAAEWGADDSPPLRAMVDADEDEADG